MTAIYLKDLQGVSIPDLADVLLGRDTSDTVERQFSLDRLFGLFNGIFQARLTTESGVPVSSSDRASQSTIYLTPYNGNKVSVYDGTRWRMYTLTEKSLALSGLTSGKNYDVFIYDTGSTLALELSAAWSSDTARTDALTLQDGVYVKSGATSRRWVGTIRTTGTTTTEDSETKRFLWNTYNKLPRYLYNINTTSHSYNSATVREWRGSTSTRLEWVCGEVHAMAGTLAAQVNANGSVYPGLDSTTSSNGAAMYFSSYLAMGTFIRVRSCSIGYHFLAPLQNCSGTVTFDQVLLQSNILG